MPRDASFWFRVQLSSFPCTSWSWPSPPFFCPALAYCVRLSTPGGGTRGGLRVPLPLPCRHSKQARQPQAPSTSSVSEDKQSKSCSVCLPSSVSLHHPLHTAGTRTLTHTHSQACREPLSFVLPFGRCPFRRICFNPPPSHAWLSLRAPSLPSRHVQNPQEDIERRYNKLSLTAMSVTHEQQ